MVFSESLRKIERAKKESSPDEKGKLFEEAAAEIFVAIRDIEKYKSNAVISDGSQEIDLIFKQSSRTELWFMGLAFFVECKCLTRKVPSKEVAFFGEKLMTAGINHGIIFSVKGLSGEGGRAAHATILRFKGRGVHIVSITSNEVRVAGDSAGLIDLIIRKYMALLTGEVL